MKIKITLIEYSPERVRVVAGWVTVGGNHYPLDYYIGPDDTVAGYGFADLLAAARTGRAFEMDDVTGAMTLEQG